MIKMDGENPAIMPDGSSIPISIPAVFVASSTGALLRDGAPPVTARVVAGPPPTREELEVHLSGLVDGLIESGSLTSSEAAAMLALLEALERRIADGQVASARSLLRTFIHRVRQLEATGGLTTEEADQLVDLANEVLASL